MTLDSTNVVTINDAKSVDDSGTPSHILTRRYSPTERTVLTLLKDLNHNLQTDSSKARSYLELFSKKTLIDLLMRDHRAVVETCS